MNPGDDIFLGEGDLLVMIGRLVAENNLLTSRIQRKDAAYQQLAQEYEELKKSADNTKTGRTK